MRRMTDLNRDETLIVFALPDEAKDCFDGYNLSFCGVGKVNATYALTRALTAWESSHGHKPKLVLNMGSAGSPRFNKGEIVNCTRFIQRDFDISPLGCEPFANPYDRAIPAILDHGLRFSSLTEGCCGTGDNFETAATQGLWDVVDMEAYALAKVCLFEKVPFACLKYISDGADGHAVTSWAESLTVTAHRLRETIDCL